MNLCFMSYAALAFYFQADVFLAAADQRLGVGALLAGQAYLLTANLLLAALFRLRPDVCGALLQLALWSLIAGPFGTIVAAGLGAFRWPAATSDFASWLQEQVEPERGKRLQGLRSALRYGRLRIEGASAVKPLSEVFLHGSQNEKLDALNAIGRRYDPVFGTALRLASKDADASVRVLASTVTAQLQAAASRAVAAKRAAAYSSSAPEAWLSLAAAHLGYEASGLLGAEQRKNESKAALAAIEQALRLASPAAANSLSELSEEFRELSRVVGGQLDAREARERVSDFAGTVGRALAPQRSAAPSEPIRRVAAS
jgi:hypothetical protein